jgi:hypothetical protein
MAMAGVFTADGNGGIGNGTIDINDSEFSPISGQAFNGGTYTVNPDGRGTVQLNVNTGNLGANFGTQGVGLDFVLANSSQGLITEFDGNGTGSGTLDIQGNVTQSQLAGSYVLAVSGISGLNIATGAAPPLALLGSIAFSASGNGDVTGSADYNNNNAASPVTIGAGSSVTIGATPGTAAFVTNLAGAQTFHFDVYPIDSTHLKFIGTDSPPNLAGDLFSQPSSSFPSGTLVFTLSGADLAGNPLAVGGLMSSDGSTTISNGAEDINDSGTTSGPAPFTGMLGTPLGGRVQVTLLSFTGGSTFAAYPSSGGVQMLEIDNVGITLGTAFVQQTPTPSLQATQGYGMNLTAANLENVALGGGIFEEDDIAEFSTTSSGFSGLIDINDVLNGQQTPGQTYRGTYTLDQPTTGRGELTTNGAYNSGIFYAVDNSTLLFLDANDGFLVGTGVLFLQNAGAQPATAHHMIVPRGAAFAHILRRRK